MKVRNIGSFLHDHATHCWEKRYVEPYLSAQMRPRVQVGPIPIDTDACERLRNATAHQA